MLIENVTSYRGHYIREARIERQLGQAIGFLTSSSAIAEKPRDALSQLKSCPLLHNCTKNHT